jgi:SAM-dependent methyltransferase
MRDMKKYLSDFDILPFEKIQAMYRKKKFFENISKLRNIDSVLEVGCGTSSIFEKQKFKNNYLVEPVSEFCDRLSKNISISDVVIQNCFLEDASIDITFDLVVLSCVLHEVPNPNEFLKKAIDLLSPDGFIYIDVPNAKSLHRLFAVATGYLNSIYEVTTTQKKMQQSAIVYTQESLNNFLEGNGLKVIESGGYFIKPFHHERMQLLVDKNIVTDRDLDGLFILGDSMGEFGSEIYALSRKAFSI